MKTFRSYNSNNRRGSVYVAVLGTAMLVTVIGTSAVWAVRIQRRSAQAANELSDARHHAQSAVDLGRYLIQQNPNWRQIFPNGTWISERTIGGGTFTLQVTDPNDGNLNDSQYDPVILTGTGIKGQARHKVQLTLAPNIQPLKALNTCLHASDKVKINGGKMITVVGAPLSTNGTLDNDGTIDGNAEAASIEDFGTITGTLTVPAPSKQMPDAAIFDTYKNKATVIPFTGIIDKRVISPGSNPWGATNPEGLYFIDTGGNDLTIRNTRINGTLVVRATGKRVILDNAVFLHNYKSDYPVLIVEGNVEMNFQSKSFGLSEVTNNANFNPQYSPYLGAWDADLSDNYPNEIQGLVHIKGTLKMKSTARVQGVIICEGQVTCEDFNKIIHDPSIYTDAPEGYIFVDGMKVSSGSWKQVVD